MARLLCCFNQLLLHESVLDSGIGLALLRMLGLVLFDSQDSATSALSLSKCLKVALVCDGCMGGGGVEILRCLRGSGQSIC